jgi:predicted dehydrogenase
MQNYRYIATTLTLEHALEQDLGRINYVMARFAADYRQWLAWGAEFRHKMRHALLLEGAVHHFDQIRNLTGGDCQTIAGWEWNPPWSTSLGEFNNLYVLRMTNGVHASYEGNGTAGGEQNTWHEEGYRVECENGAVTVGRDKIVRIHRFRRGGGLSVQEVPLVKQAHPGHVPIKDQAHGAVMGQFLDWLDGGPTPETTIQDNIKSIAIVFAAIEASESGQSVDVAAKVAAATG